MIHIAVSWLDSNIVNVCNNECFIFTWYDIVTAVLLFRVNVMHATFEFLVGGINSTLDNVCQL